MPVILVVYINKTLANQNYQCFNYLTHASHKCTVEPTSATCNTNNKGKLETDYFVIGQEVEIERTASAKATMEMHNDFSDTFMDIGCFKGTFH